jgi:hypothetical protein
MKITPPCLLDLAVELTCPAVRHGLIEKSIENDTERIPEGLEIALGAAGVDGSAVGTAVAFYRDWLLAGLEIAEHEAVSPETTTSTRRASGRLLPGITPAELAKLLYINRAV